MSMPCHKDRGGYVLREPCIEDGLHIHRLVERSKSMDLNSLYSYLLLADHFHETCVVAQNNGALIGFISAYVHPGKKNTLFVWQVVVDEQERRKGIARKMLENLVMRVNLKTISYLETTINPSNQSSRFLFESFAKNLHAPCTTSLLFSSDLFGDTHHESEMMYRIGPFHAQ